MFEPGDLQGTIALAQRLTADRAWRSTLGEAARRQVSEWSWERGADVVRENYQRAVDKHSMRSARSKQSPVASFLLASLVKVYKLQARLARSDNPGHADK